MRTIEIRINGIKIDWVKQVPKNIEVESTNHTVQQGTRPDITSYSRVKNRVIPLQCCIVDTIFSKDKDINYDKLYELASKKEEVQIDTKTSIFIGLLNIGNNYEEKYAITKITERARGENFIEFDMVLEARYYATLKTISTSIEPQKYLTSKASKGSSKKIGIKGLKEKGLVINY